MEVLTTLLLIQSEVLGETIVTPKSQVHVCPTTVENFNFPFCLLGNMKCEITSGNNLYF